MTDPPPGHRRPLLVDACVALNLLASGVDLAEVAGACGATLLMAHEAAREAIWLDPLNVGDAREMVDLQNLAGSGRLAVVEMAAGAQSTFVELARELDDGEAATIAIALDRGIAVATDDRKGLRVATEKSVPLIWRTSELMFAWAGTAGDAKRVEAALTAIEVRAHFRPNRNDPRRDWWQRARHGSG